MADENKSQEEEKDVVVVFDEPAVFDISFRFAGVSKKPEEIEAVTEAIVEEAERRGLFYDGGYVAIRDSTIFIPNPKSDLASVLAAHREDKKDKEGDGN